MDHKTLIELSKLTERLVEDRFYELALSEIEENSFDPVAKAKAFEEAEGKEQKARAFYVKHRVRRMKDELAAFLLNEEAEQKKPPPKQAPQVKKASGWSEEFIKNRQKERLIYLRITAGLILFVMFAYIITTP